MMRNQHIPFIKSRINRSVVQLSDELKFADRDDPAYVTDLRKVTVNVQGAPVEVVVCFVQASDSLSLGDTGWVINAGCNACLQCGVRFSVRCRRHHCRGCGLLLCAKCCNRTSLIEGFGASRRERVCGSCWESDARPVKAINNRCIGIEVVDNSPFKMQPTALSVDEAVRPDPLPDADADVVLSIVPFPGFVIKTRRMGGAKVFINVYHHHSVRDVDESLLASATRCDQPTTTVPVFYFGMPSEVVLDNVPMHRHTVYNVVVSSSYFLSADGRLPRITEPLCIQKIMECLNSCFADCMQEEEYVRPRIKSGVKGSPLSSPTLFRLNAVQASSFLRINACADNRSVASRSQHSCVVHADDESVISDLTLQSVPARSLGLGSPTPSTRKFFPSRRRSLLLTPDVLVNWVDGALTVDESAALLLASTVKPSVLLGWLVQLDSDQGIYVITDIAKNRHRQSQFRLSGSSREEFWTRLQRSDAKPGLVFRPLRKVMDL